MTVDERASAEAPSLTLPQPSLEPTMYINRELSLIDYQQRVFEEALDERNPLLERVKFLAIFGSNVRRVLHDPGVGHPRAGAGRGRATRARTA